MNELFLERMKEMLKDEYPAYLKKLNDQYEKGYVLILLRLRRMFFLRIQILI